MLPPLWCLVMCGLLLGVCRRPGRRRSSRAAAADLQPVMPVLAQAYEHATGMKLVVSYGSSSTLATQIIERRADRYLSRRRLYVSGEDSGGGTGGCDRRRCLCEGNAGAVGAQGLAVAAAEHRSADRSAGQVDGDRRPAARSVRARGGRGAAQDEAVDKLKPQLVVAENIAQTAQFVESGNAQLGLISLTTASSQHFKEIGTYVLVPTSSIRRFGSARW